MDCDELCVDRWSKGDRERMKEMRRRGYFSPFHGAGTGGIFLSVLVSWVKGEEEQETASGALARGSGEALCFASFRLAAICYTIRPSQRQLGKRVCGGQKLIYYFFLPCVHSMWHIGSQLWDQESNPHPKQWKPGTPREIPEIDFLITSIHNPNRGKMSYVTMANWEQLFIEPSAVLYIYDLF